jgi:hypothetical protein
MLFNDLSALHKNSYRNSIFSKIKLYLFEPVATRVPGSVMRCIFKEPSSMKEIQFNSLFIY